MTTPDDAQYERQKLSELLRRLRAEAGVSGAEAARRAGFGQPKLSKIENGLLLPSVNDATALCRSYQASDEQRSEILDLVRALRNEVESTRVILQRGAYRKQHEIGAIEAETTWLRDFQMSIVSGFLQTTEYMRRVARTKLTGADAERWLTARRERQRILKDETKRFTMLHTEGSLRWRIGPPAMMVEQIRHLSEVSHFGNLRLGLIPWRMEASVFPSSGFHIYDDRLVIVGTKTATATIKDPRDIAEYVELFTALEEMAVFGDEARVELERIAADYERLD
ncbi:MAG: helix-turn-helix domain-containing protein [Micromonosporaceae bacterium]